MIAEASDPDLRTTDSRSMDVAFEAALDEAEGRDSARRRAYALFRNLSRLADRHPPATSWLSDALRGRLQDLASIALEVTTEAGAPMAVALIAELQREDDSSEGLVQLQVLCDDAKYRSSVHLQEPAILATRKLLDFLETGRDRWNVNQRQEYARLANNLGSRLGRAGQWAEALRRTESAVEIRRALDLSSSTDGPRADLAASLTNLGGALAAVGRREGALQPLREAVAIYRKLEQQILSDLGMSLNNLGLGLGDAGQTEESLRVLEEAFETRKRLARLQPSNPLLADLARSMTTYGNRLSDLGLLERALQITEEAVDIQKDLVDLRRDVYLPDLARSLVNRGLHLGDLGRLEEALLSLEHAVKIYRDLLQMRPEAYLPDFALALANLGGRYFDLARSTEALAVTEQAVDIYRQLARTLPEGFVPDLAGSLGNLGRVLCDLGRPEEAFQAVDEAIRRLSPFFFEAPAALKPWMASVAESYYAVAGETGAEYDRALLAGVVEVLQDLTDGDGAGEA